MASTLDDTPAPISAATKSRLRYSCGAKIVADLLPPPPCLAQPHDSERFAALGTAVIPISMTDSGGGPAAEVLISCRLGELVFFSLFFYDFSTILGRPGLRLIYLFRAPWAIGPDGVVYAINNATLFAVGR